MKTVIFIIVFLLLISTAYCQIDDPFIEITETDITLYPKAKSNEISVFNIKLGMSQNDAENILKQNSKLFYYIDEDHTTYNDFRIFVYDKDKNKKKGNCILYLIWDNTGNELSKLVLFEDAASYLKDNTQKLLTFEVFDPNSKISQNYLGYPNKSKVTLDIPSLNLKHTTYYYYSKGIEITLKESKGEKTVAFAFSLTK